MLEELQTSIMTRFNSAAGATLRGLVQGMWEDLAPGTVISGTQTGQELEKSTLPFIVFSIISTGLEQNFCADFYTPLVQFTVFGDGDNKTSISVLEIGGELLNLFNGKTLSMANGYSMIRADIIGQRKIKDDNNFWQVIYEMEFLVEKTVTREAIT